MMSNAHAISAVMYKSLRYDPINDFQMVSMVATAGLVLVAAPAFPASDLAGVLAAVRANPGKSISAAPALVRPSISPAS